MTELIGVLALLGVLGAVGAGRLIHLARGRRRSEGGDEDETRIDVFWSWWREASAEIAREIEAGRAAELVEEITARVRALDPGLAWELGPGTRSRHQLTLSSEGDPVSRVLLERWLTRAPPPDATWAYHPARQPYPADRVRLRISGVEIAFLDCRFAFEEVPARERLHVAVFHPALEALPAGQREVAVFVLLDQALGEDAVERWIGAVEPVVSVSADSRTPDVFLAAVEALGASATGERFAMVQTETPEGPVVATVNLALKWIDHLLKDTHYALRFALEGPTEKGLPGVEELQALAELENDVLERLGDQVIFIGHETGRGHRTLHLHAAAAGPAGDRLRDWLAEHPGRQAELVVTADPQWSVLDRFQ